MLTPSESKSLKDCLLSAFVCTDNNVLYAAKYNKKQAKHIRKKQYACNKLFEAFMSVMSRHPAPADYEKMENAVYGEIGIIGWFFIRWLASEILHWLWHHTANARQQNV